MTLGNMRQNGVCRLAGREVVRRCTPSRRLAHASGANEKRAGGDRPLQEKMTVQAAASFRLAV
jgi:hypothetical protein